MQTSRTSFYILVSILLVAGSLHIWHRHTAFNVPWLPGEKQQIWTIEAKVEFFATGDSVKASLAIPNVQAGFKRIGEHTASPGYGLAFTDAGMAAQSAGRRAQWSIREAAGKQTLYYRIDVLEEPSAEAPSINSSEIPRIKKNLIGTGPYVTEARQMLARAKARSADGFTLARELIREFNTQKQSAEFLAQSQSRSLWLVELLGEADVPAREVFSLLLEDGRRHLSLNSLIQVFEVSASNNNTYEFFNPETGRQGKSANQFLWEDRSGSLLDLIGGNQSSVYFSVIRQEVPTGRVQEIFSGAGNDFSDNAYLDFSIHSLPVEEQAMFKGILLIPVGVLLVVFMRIFVGLRTSGTFMPVLIAIAFIQTSLITGLVGFILIVGVGLMIRSYLSRLNLLLVARISAVIIAVIIMIATFSVVASQLGLNAGLKITFFPMIILSWTIERMSILWEEEGAQEVFIQGGGSLFVAVLAYALMMNDVVRHLTFNFLGVQLLLMVAILVMGNYTGYRLFELWRFSHFLKKP